MQAICPNGHRPDTDTPFYYPPCCVDVDVELGILAYSDTSLSNRWIDGTAGIPDEIAQAVHTEYCMPHCIECGEETEWDRGGSNR